jgi:membrane protease YdiL (CAAX protease family)
VLTSVLFAGLHGGSAFLPIFGLSLVLGALMLRTGRLASVAVVHALHNGAMLVLVFLAPEVAGSSAEPAPSGLLPLTLLLP